jgi:acetate kinase
VRLLVVNAGSSSLKLSLLDEQGEVAAVATVENWRGPEHLAPLQEFLAACGPVDGVGHRVVHGGPRHFGPERIDDDLVDGLGSIRDLAPLHMSRALAGIRAIEELLPGAPQVACFDTTFHATLSPAAATYALPREWNERWGLRRYGFHGLSHAYAVRRAAEIVGRPVSDLRIVSAHLGAGASLAAVRDGLSVDTTMGFTPLAGLVMNTRSGSVDPGLLLWLVEHGGLSVPELDEALENEAGLKGLSGTSGDLRDVLAGVAAGDAACVLARDVYVHRLARETAAMTAATGGLDLLVFTGGVGEHAWQVRSALADALSHLGLAIDAERNRATTTDADIGAAGARARTVVVTAREDLEIRRQVLAVLSFGSSPAAGSGRPPADGGE